MINTYSREIKMLTSKKKKNFILLSYTTKSVYRSVSPLLYNRWFQVPKKKQKAIEKIRIKKLLIIINLLLQKFIKYDSICYVMCYITDQIVFSATRGADGCYDFFSFKSFCKRATQQVSRCNFIISPRLT
jgi:hypothetical protein